MPQDLVRIPVAINTRRYGPMDKVACALLFFLSVGALAVRKAEFRSLVPHRVPWYRTSAARDPRSTTTPAPGRRGATRYMLQAHGGRVDDVLRAG